MVPMASVDRPILEIRNVKKRFGSLQAVSDCTFSVEERKIIGLIGPNGAGKSTLFGLITGFLTPDSGEILFRGEDICRQKPYVIARKGIGRTFQITRVFPKLTVMENLFLAARAANGRARALELLKFAEVADLEEEYAGNLSFGQQKLVSLMQVVVSEPDLILLDEPAAGINPTLQNKIISLIHHLNNTGKTFLIIEHNMDVVMRNCDKVVVLAAGEKIAEGSGEEVRRNEAVLKAYFGG